MTASSAKKFEDLDGVNTANNPHLDQIDVARRQWIRSNLAAVTLLASSPAAFATKAPSASRKSAIKSELLSFTAVPIAVSDAVVVPLAYEAQVLFRWGDAVGDKQGAPTFKADASNAWQEQALQAGMHHDGIEYFPLNRTGSYGLLAMNHEYTDDGLLHSDGMKNWSADKVRKAQEAHGVSVIEVQQQADGSWRVLPAFWGVSEILSLRREQKLEALGFQIWIWQ